MDIAEVFDLPLSDPDLWEKALTHRSYASEHPPAETNERLEFLGDAILGMVITDLAYERFPELPEGELAKLRAATVRQSTLADAARHLGLGQLLRLGHGEELGGGRDKASILADCMEAVIGAHYRDKGLDKTRALIERVFWPAMQVGPAPDYKSLLNERALREFGAVPDYDFTSEGPLHEQEFTASVCLRGEKYGTGQGGSKKEAAQRAARQALEVLGPSRS